MSPGRAVYGEGHLTGAVTLVKGCDQPTGTQQMHLGKSISNLTFFPPSCLLLMLPICQTQLEAQKTGTFDIDKLSPLGHRAKSWKLSSALEERNRCYAALEAKGSGRKHNGNINETVWQDCLKPWDELFLRVGYTLLRTFVYV